MAADVACRSATDCRWMRQSILADITLVTLLPLKFATFLCSNHLCHSPVMVKPIYLDGTFEKIQLSAARIITGLRNTCPRDIVLFEADLQPLSLRRRACLSKYYNKFRSPDSRNRTSAYFKDWCNNQRLWRNSPFSQMVSFKLTVSAVEPHHMS
ncbi:RNase H domain-containing protein [Trichonephila clavipes]|nr:RNase H domain-containing protein [Trichonephila clavipes]